MKIKDEDITVEIHSDGDIKEYTSFIQRNCDSTIYHTYEWINIVKKNFGYKPYFLLARNKDDKISAVLPLFFVNNFYGKRLDSIPYSPYGGIVGNKEYTKPLINKAIELKKQLNCKLLIIKDDPTSNNGTYNQFDMAKYENWYHQVVKIESPDIMWNNLKRTNRENLSKAQKNDKLSFEKVSSEEEVIEFYDLVNITYRKLGFLPFSFDLFLDIWNDMYKKGYVEIFIIRQNNKAISSALNFLFKNRFFVAFAGWDHEKKMEKANNYLDWMSMLWCYQKSYDILDFGLTTKDNDGLYYYKSSFGSINYPYAQYYFPNNSSYVDVHNLLLKTSRIFLKRTPGIIHNKFGNFINRRFI